MDFQIGGIHGKSKLDGSGSLKHERSDPFEDEDEDEGTTPASKPLHDLCLRSDDNEKHQMLSFSSPTNKPQIVSFEDVRSVSDKNGFSFHHNHNQTPSIAPTYYNSRPSPGYMNGSFTGIKGPFTPAQWIELEHQAMIYKYLTANVPVPSNLLIPIRKAIQSTGFPGFSIGSYPSHTYGWGSFHIGFSGNTDPEPGRCRRTDGKKWRCSKDAVPDQKYCERHINRGRHRSRKPVEGRAGQAASGATTTTKMLPPMCASMPSLVTSGGGGVPNGIAIAQHQTLASTDSVTDRRREDQQGGLVTSPTVIVESKGSQYCITKQHISYGESSVSEFGIVSNDSLLNPSQKSSYSECKAYTSLLEFNNPQQNQDEYPLQLFTENWPPKDLSHPHRSDIPWPKDLKSDWTQLSMSIPESSDFSLSSPSPSQEKVTVSPLGLGMGSIVTEGSCKTSAWIPIAFGGSMGGPLGEVLNNTSGVEKGEGCWGDGSPGLGSSPTGVLRKSTFVSVSNSSSCGSPRGEKKKTVECPPGLCDELVGVQK